MIVSAATKTKPKSSVLAPCGDRVVCRFIDADDVSKGGIVLPTGAQVKPMFAKVLAVGPGRIAKMANIKDNRGNMSDPDAFRNPAGSSDVDAAGYFPVYTPMSCKEGDTICLNQYAGCPVDMDDEKFQIIRDEDVMAVVETS